MRLPPVISFYVIAVAWCVERCPAVQHRPHRPQLTLSVSKVRLRYAEQHHQRSSAQSARTDL